MLQFLTIIRAFFSHNFSGVSPLLVLVTLGSITFQYIITYIDNKETENKATLSKMMLDINMRIQSEGAFADKNSDTRYQAMFKFVEAKFDQCQSDTIYLKTEIRDAQRNIINIYRDLGIKQKHLPRKNDVPRN